MTFENVNFSMKNTQTSQQHTKKHVSDTALESLDIILSGRIILGTILVRMVPENDIHSIEFSNKTFHSNPQMKYYKNTTYPSSTQNLIIPE